MTLTNRLKLPYPELPDAADVPLWARGLAQLLDNITATFDWGLQANRPAAGVEGFFYFATDTGILTFDDGTGLHEIGALSAGSVTRAMLHAQLKVATGTALPADEAIRALGTIANTAAAGDDARFPTATQKAALAGTVGTPSDTNRYVTQSDPLLAYVVSVLPSSPTPGQHILYPAHTPTHKYWHLIYLGGVWVYIGGPPIYDRIDTEQTLVSNNDVWASLATPGPQLTVPENGLYITRHGARISTDVDVGSPYMSYKIGATEASDDDAATASSAGVSSGNKQTVMMRHEKTLTKNTLLLSRYKIDQGVGDSSPTFYSHRWMELQPIYLTT